MDSRFFAKIYIQPKESVLDPQGQAVKEALHTLNFPEVESLRIGKYIELQLLAPDMATASERVKKYCETVLANPVIEGYRFDINLGREK